MLPCFALAPGKAAGSASSQHEVAIDHAKHSTFKKLAMFGLVASALPPLDCFQHAAASLST